MKVLTKIVAVEWKEPDRFKSHQEVECEQYSCNMHFFNDHLTILFDPVQGLGKNQQIRASCYPSDFNQLQPFSVSGDFFAYDLSLITIISNSTLFFIKVHLIPDCDLKDTV